MKTMRFDLPRFLLVVLLLGRVPGVGAQTADAALQAKIDDQIKLIQSWAAEPVIVSSVRAQNAHLSPDLAVMTQDEWKDLSKLDPLVRHFDQNPAGVFLKGRKSAVVIRSFLSDASGFKVAFTSKPLNWSDNGDPKHDVPMTGKTWQGIIEQDKVSGLQQVEVSVPVLDAGKPIGSLVVSLNVYKL
jgi:hypothetical protein